MRNDTTGAITAAAACPLCGSAAGVVCVNTSNGVPFVGQQVHTERLHAANCTCMRIRPGSEGPWHIIPNPSCDIHGDTQEES